MSISTDIKNLIITSVNGLASTQTVYGYRELNPSGWPAVWVTTSDMDGTFATTAENRRIYAYSVTCLWPLGEDFEKDGTPREEYAEEVLATVVDEIINVIDDRGFLNTINTYGSGDTVGLFIEASDAQWGEIDFQKGKAKAVQMLIRIHTDYNTAT
jgi:hypothetical protein